MEYCIRIYCEDERLDRLIVDRLHAELSDNPYYRERRIILNTLSPRAIIIWIQFGIEIPSCLEMSNIDKIVKECKEALE